MANLVTTATIRAHDQLTGPLNSIASRVSAINGRLAGGAAMVGAAGQRMGAGLGVGALSMGLMLDKAEEFNKNIFGLGAASIIEGMDDAGKINLDKPLHVMGDMTDLSLKMSAAMGFSATKISGMLEVLAKAGKKDVGPAKMLEDTAKAAVALSKADSETDPKHIADFLHTLSVIQKAPQGDGYGAWVRKQADMVVTAADQTKLSVGSIMEGMRQFQTIGAGMGLGTDQMLSLMMVGAQRGFGPAEMGTAVKSDLVRVLKPTAEGQAALNLVLGRIGKDLSDYSARTALDPQRSLSNLNRSVGGGITGNFGASIRQQLFDAQRGQYTTSDGFIDKIASQIAKAKGIADHEGMQNIRNAVVNSITTSTGDLKAFDLMRDLVVGGATDAEIASIFEGRQLARNKAFLEGFRGRDGRASEYDQNLQLLRRMNGQGLDAIETLWSRSPLGNMEAMKAGFERIVLRLANAPAVQQFVNLMERAAGALENTNGKAIALAAGAAVLGTIAAPAMLAARGLWAVSAASGAALLGLGRIAAMPLVAAARGLGALAIGMSVLGNGNLAMAAAGLSRFAGALGLMTRIVAPFAAIGAVVGLLNTDWSKVTGGEGFQKLMGSLSGLGTTLKTAAEGVLSLFGISLEGMSLYKAFDWLIGTIGQAIGKVNELLELMVGQREIKTGGSAGAFGGGAKNMPSMMGEIRMPDTGPANLELGASNAQTMGSMIADAVRGALTGVTINVSGVPNNRGGAQSPAPTTTNGQSYGGR